MGTKKASGNREKFVPEKLAQYAVLLFRPTEENHNHEVPTNAVNAFVFSQDQQLVQIYEGSVLRICMCNTFVLCQSICAHVSSCVLYVCVSVCCILRVSGRSLVPLSKPLKLRL